MRTRRRSRKTHRMSGQRGFTLIEMIIIVAVVGILAIAVAPSFASMLDTMKVDQTVNEIRMAFQDTQRQAIRKSQECVVQVPTTSGNSPSSNLPQWWLDLLARYFPNRGSGETKQVTGNCLTSGSPELSPSVDLASNVKTATLTSSASGAIVVKFGSLGSAEFLISSSVAPPALPSDPTGKIVVFMANKEQIKKKCVAISSILGLTRVGTYTGGTRPVDITDSGVCTALEWTQQ